MATNFSGNVAGGEIRSACITSFVDEGTVQSSRLYHSRRTVCEMLHDRGYDVPNSDLTRSLADFRSLFGQNPDVECLRFAVSLRSDPNNKVLVIFLGTDDVKTQVMRNIYGQILNKETLSRLIIILQSKMTSPALKETQKWPFKVEIFKINDLLVNITKHVLQPKYEVLATDEKQKLLDKYKLEAKQLPLMQKSDAIAQYYGLERGQVVKVTHSGGLLDAFETYRCVV